MLLVSAANAIPAIGAALFAFATTLGEFGPLEGGMTGNIRAAERFLAWILLLPIGVTGLWAGVSHIFFPAIAAAHIGWQVGPFQFEVGMADLAVGVTACIAFWRDLSFKAAAVCAASVFLLGDAIGHVRDMVEAGNFAPGNAGLPFYMDIACPVLAIVLLAIAKRQHAAGLDARR